MVCKINKCCCCIPIKAGALLIGALHVLYLVLSLYKQAYVNAALNLFTGTIFLVMLYKDSKFTRMAFFASFITQVVLIIALDIFFTFFPLIEDQKRF